MLQARQSQVRWMDKTCFLWLNERRQSEEMLKFMQMWIQISPLLKMVPKPIRLLLHRNGYRILLGRGLDQPEDWPAKSPDMNPYDFFLWGKMLHEFAKRRCQVKNTDSLKVELLEIWNGISQDGIKKARKSFVKRLHKVVDCKGRHIETYL